MTHVLKSSFTVLLLIGIAGAECSARKKTTKLPPDPRFEAVGNISVLPIVDTRAGKKAGVNMRKLQGSVASTLKKKHYSVSAGDTLGSAEQVDVEDLETPEPLWIKKLGPPDTHWVMVVCLDDVTSKITFGSTGNAKLTGYLFDKDSGGVIWKGKGVGQAGQGGLMGMTMKGMMKGEALQSAVSSLLSSVPKRPKSVK